MLLLPIWDNQFYYDSITTKANVSEALTLRSSLDLDNPYIFKSEFYINTKE